MVLVSKETMFKVAFLGIKSSEYQLIGIRVYTLSVDKTIEIVQNHGPKGELSDTQFGLTPNRECHVLCSGRESPFTSKAEVLEMINDIDVLIISACTELVFARLILSWLTPETIPEGCTIVLRLPFPQDTERPFLTYPSELWFEDMKITPKGKPVARKKFNKKIKTFVLGEEKYGGISPEKGIPMLHRHLLQKECIVTHKVSKPIHETALAGKSLFGLISNWITQKFNITS